MESYARKKISMALLLVGGFFYMANAMLVNPIITGYAETMGSDGATMGFIGGLLNLSSLFFRPLAGILSDKINRKVISIIGAITMSGAAVGYVFSDSLLSLIVSRIANGAGYAMCSVAMTAWLADMLPKEKIGSGIGVYGTMNALSMAISPTIGVTIAPKFGYRAAFIIAAVAGAFSALIMLFIMRPPQCYFPQKTAASRKNLCPIDVKILPVALTVTLLALPYCATQSFLVRYAAIRIPNINVSFFFPAYAVTLLIMRIGFRRLFDKVKYGVFVVVCCLSAVGAIICLTFLNGFLTLILAAILLAGSYGLACSVCQSRAISLAGEGKKGAANATYYVGLDLGMVLGPVIAGIMFDLWTRH